MNRIARVQVGAGISTIIALPLVYIGGTQGAPALTVIGFVIFALGMVAVPLLRILPAQRTAPPPK